MHYARNEFSPRAYEERWIAVTLTGEAVSNFYKLCLVEIARYRETAIRSGESKKHITGHLLAVAKFLKQNPQSVNFKQVSEILAVDKAHECLTVVSVDAPANQVAKRLIGDLGKVETAPESMVAKLAGVAILTVQNILGDCFIESAAFQLGEQEKLERYQKYYKYGLVPSTRRNDWFFAAGYTSAIYEIGKLVRMAASPALIDYRRNLAAMFMDGLLDCFDDVPPEQKNHTVREALLDRIDFQKFGQLPA